MRLQWRAVERAYFQSPGAILRGSVRRALGRSIAPVLRRQVDGVWESADSAYRLHLGCGSVHLTNWINIRQQATKHGGCQMGSAARYTAAQVVGCTLPTASTYLNTCLSQTGQLSCVTAGALSPQVARSGLRCRISRQWCTTTKPANGERRRRSRRRRYCVHRHVGEIHQCGLPWMGAQVSLRLRRIRSDAQRGWLRDVVRCERSISSVAGLANLEQRAESRLVVEAQRSA